MAWSPTTTYSTLAVMLFALATPAAVCFALFAVLQRFVTRPTSSSFLPIALSQWVVAVILAVVLALFVVSYVVPSFVPL